MDEGEGDIVYDHSKNKNHGKIVGGSWTEDDDKGTCLLHDGINDYTTIDIGGLADDEDYITLQFDAYMLSQSSDKYLVDLHSSISDRILIRHNSSDEIVLHDDVNNNSNDIHGYSNPASWKRYTFIFNENWTFYFVDGQLISVSTFANNLSFEDLDPDYLVIGRAHGTLSYGKVYMKNLKLFNSVRWDVAYGYDQTPATVFVHDDNRFDKENYSVPDDSDCVLLLHMDEGSGSTTYDASGEGHDGTLINTPTWTDTSFRGEAGTSIDFNGTTELITCPDDADYSFAGDVPFSVECWFNVDDIVSDQQLVNKNDDNAQREWMLYLASGIPRFILTLQNSWGDRIGRIINSAVTANQWYYICATYDGSKSADGMNIYLNGVASDTDNYNGGTYTGMTAGTSTVNIGANKNGGAYTSYFDGEIDEVRIHRRELSAAEIAARYRSEPYLHDIYQATRVYNKNHRWKGLPVISNGLIKLAFPDYDTYEIRTANVLMPVVYAWYENSWHLLGSIYPYSYISGADRYFSTDADSTEWDIIELTDQSCTMRITYNETSGTLPEGTKLTLKLTIRNGFPGVLIETDDRDWLKEDQLGYQFGRQNTTGAGSNYSIIYMPEDQLYNEEVDTTFTRVATDIDDNWLVAFHNKDNSNAPSFNVIAGMFHDFLYDDLGSNETWQGLDSSGYYAMIAKGTKRGGVFFMPYDVDDLLEEGEIMEDAGNFYTTVLAPTSSNGNYVATESGGESARMIFAPDLFRAFEAGVFFGSGIVLPAGSYIAVFRLARTIINYNFWVGVDDGGSNARRYSAWTEGYEVAIPLTAINTWYQFYVPFYADGTTTYYPKVEFEVAGATAGNEYGYLDLIFIVPQANAIDYPADLAHQGTTGINLTRGLKK